MKARSCWAPAFGLAIVLSACALAAPASALGSNCSACSWSGGGATTNNNWSNGANWSGGNLPSTSVTSLTFPGTVTCSTSGPPDPCQSNDDLATVSTGSFSVDMTTGYSVFGSNGISLGAGGLQGTTTSSKCTFSGPGGSPFIQLPMALTADQTWTLTGCPGSSGFSGLALFGTISGGSHAVTSSMSSGAQLSLANMNAGHVAFSASSPSEGDFVSLYSISGPGGSASLNGTSHSPVTFTNLGFGIPFSNADTGPLTFNGSFFVNGSTGTTVPVVTVHGDTSFDSASSYQPAINQPGTEAGTDFSQLNGLGNITLAGFLSIQGGDPSTGNCPVLHVGDVLPLITATGSLTGSFSNAPNGSTVTMSCFGGGTPATLLINYSANSMTATVVSTTTTTLGTSPSSSVTNQVVTLTASVGDDYNSSQPPTGSVEFDNQGSPISGCGSVALNASGAASCQTSFTASSSPEHLTAKYTPTGGSGFSSSNSSPVNYTVAKDTTSTTLSTSNSSPAIGQSVTYTATVASAHAGAVNPSGTVAFNDGSSPISGCSAQPLNASGTATCTTSYSSAGAHAITASYGGDGNFGGSSSSGQTVTVQPAPTPTTSVDKVRASGASVKVTLTCNGVSGSTCTDTIRLSVHKKLNGGRVVGVTALTKKLVVVGTRTVTLVAGQTETVTVPLNRAGKRLLATWHTLKVSVRITQSGTAVASRSVKLKKKHH